MSSTIADIRKAVDELFDFRNNYFTNHGIEKYASKEEEVNCKLEETLKLLNIVKEECEKEDKAVYCMLHGKALNVKPTFDPLSFEWLSKAVKLNPKLTEAWNQLGECYWKKGDLEAAYNCFEGSLKQDKKDKTTLRNLSMLLRQLGNTYTEKQSNLLRSLDIAKEAVSLDVNDGLSWYYLGNAYFCLFFASSKRDAIKQCKAAYSKAILDPLANSQPDFLFNYAVCLQYEESYQESLEYFAKASLLDPSWNEPRDMQILLRNFIRDVNEMVSKKGSLKPKRMQSMLSTIKPEIHLGSHKNNLELVKVNQLTTGINKQRVFLGKIIGCVSAEKMLCHTFCVMDCEQNCASLSIYNLNVEKGPKISDSIAIAEPYFRFITTNYRDLNVSYPSIRIDNPLSLMINGKHAMQDCVAIPRISFKVTSE